MLKVKYWGNNAEGMMGYCPEPDQWWGFCFFGNTYQAKRLLGCKINNSVEGI